LDCFFVCFRALSNTINCRQTAETAVSAAKKIVKSLVKKGIKKAEKEYENSRTILKYLITAYL